MKKFFKTISIICALFCALLLLGSAATAHISPVKLKILTLAGFGFPALWVINLFILIWFAIRKKWRFIIPLIALIITINHWNNTFQLTGKKIKNELSCTKHDGRK